MQRSQWGSLAVVVVLCGIAAVARAEQPASTDTSAAAPAAAPAAAQIASVEGVLSAMDWQSAAPSITVSGANGQSWTLWVDPQTTSVWNGAQISKLEALQSGDRIKVRYMAKDGTNWAKSIDILLASTPAASSAVPTTSTVPATSGDTSRSSY